LMICVKNLFISPKNPFLSLILPDLPA